MKFLFEILALCLCAIIIFSKGKTRARALLFSVFFVPPVFGTAHILFSIAVIISLVLNKEIKGELKSFPLKNISFAILLIYFIISLLDKRLSLIGSIVRPIIYFIQTYLWLFIGYSLFKQEKDWREVIRILFQVLSIFAVYGLVTWIIQRNPWNEFVDSVYGGGSMWVGIQERGYRVYSFLNNPIAYGCVMTIGALSIWPLYLRTRSKMILAFLLLIICNVFLSNSRTDIILLGLSIILYILFYYGLSVKAIAYLGGICIGVGILYFNVDSIRSVMNSVFDIFISGGSNLTGSSIEMRELQLTTAFMYFNESPFWGHGLQYFSENIQPQYGTRSGLAGLESYAFRLLVEMGLFMIIAFIIYVFRFIYIANRRKSCSLQISSLVLAQFVAFVFFLIATGDYGNVFEYCLIIIGVNLKYLMVRENSRKYTKINLNTYASNEFISYNEKIRC